MVPSKPPISIFQRPVTPPAPPSEPPALPSPPRVVAAKATSRAEDDKPSRYSDIEDSPPLQAADLRGDDIPRFGGFESDGEWTLPAKPAQFSNLFLVETPDGDTQQLEFGQEPTKTKKRKKKSKGVLHSLPR